MAKHQYELVLTLLVVASLGIVSFVSCIAAEIKRTKEDELKLLGRMCYLPESQAFGFGVAALICLLAAQMVGNLIFCSYVCSRDEKKKKKMKGTSSTTATTTSSKAKRPTVSMALLSISWMSFVIGGTLLSTATSMSREQPYGRGWLDGECYLVRQGIYIGSGILILIAIGCTLALIIVTATRSRVEDGFKVKDQSTSSGLP
ncbi:hypothetical protein D8674_028288 [Pyrus ussuriensis x Pyrus communis]|uniref:Uncharacterized protein n=1 Tax=Pyrus ussuriensis x Pyrus communis TaxID=2448454 RepID=A0A5N5I0Q8_9ROSA|nr:hypothetical protein D8674_028288 [Pyrus ussuriensis x Pyrus communis]